MLSFSFLAFKTSYPVLSFFIIASFVRKQQYFLENSGYYYFTIDSNVFCIPLKQNAYILKSAPI